MNPIYLYFKGKKRGSSASYHPLDADEDDSMLSMGKRDDICFKSDKSLSNDESGWVLAHFYKRRLKIISLSFLFVSFIILILVATTTSKRYLKQGNQSVEYPDKWAVHKGGSRKYQHCGKSPKEAKELGCVWDLMSYSWIHPACYDKVESEEWLSTYGPWNWYLERNSSKSEALDEEILPYTPYVWAQQGYHVVHCLYIWKLMHIAAMSGHLMSDEALPLGHTGHCVKMIGNSTLLPFETINTRVKIIYATCVSLE